MIGWNRMGLQNVMMLLCGLGLFLYGMNLMGEGLELAAGSKLKNMIERLTTNRYIGALVGLVVTAVIQSSSATTVMVIGFVNAGVMSLSQAAGVIMGANIGTTVTGLLIAIRLNDLAPFAIFLGVIGVLFIKKHNRKHIAQIILGFGILFFGMTNMSAAMAPLAQDQGFCNLLSSFKNPLLGLLVGLGVTAIIQSSSASLGVLQALSASGAIGLDSAVYVIFGQNIGTCATALLASIGTTKTARRTAIVHLLFNVIGATAFTLISYFTPFVSVVEHLVPDNPMMQISLVHICFNVVTTAVLLPLSDHLVNLACRVVPGIDQKMEAMRLQYLDERILNTPPVAVSQVIKEVIRMSRIARSNFLLSMDMIYERNADRVPELEENESILNFLNKGITAYLVKINGLELEDQDRETIGAMYHVVNDIERIGDYSENISEEAQIVADGKATMSDAAISELKQLQEKVLEVFDSSIELFANGGSKQELGFVVNKTEEQVDELTEYLKANHIERLKSGECSPQSGSVYNDLLINLERIADHATNVAFSVHTGKPLAKLPELAVAGTTAK
jgi:phosphate:Na+ symporter